MDKRHLTLDLYNIYAITASLHGILYPADRLTTCVHVLYLWAGKGDILRCGYTRGHDTVGAERAIRPTRGGEGRQRRGGHKQVIGHDGKRLRFEQRKHVGVRMGPAGR
jgi:hypothetical protein